MALRTVQDRTWLVFDETFHVWLHDCNNRLSMLIKHLNSMRKQDLVNMVSVLHHSPLIANILTIPDEYIFSRCSLDVMSLNQLELILH